VKRLLRVIVRYFEEVTAEEPPPIEELVEGLTEEQVKAYFEKNADIDLSVPLGVARQVREEVTWKMARGNGITADGLARMQGMLAGIARFEDLYCAALEHRERLARAKK